MLESLEKKQLALKRLTDTRWSAHMHADAIKALSLAYTQIQEALKCLSDDENQTRDTINEAQNLLKSMLLFETVFMAEIWNNILQRFNKVSIALQKENMGLGIAMKLLKSLQVYVVLQRENFDQFEQKYKTKRPKCHTKMPTNVKYTGKTR